VDRSNREARAPTKEGAREKEESRRDGDDQEGPHQDLTGEKMPAATVASGDMTIVTIAPG